MNDLFLRAARGEKVERTPVWFMRQAGRSLPGYRELRKTHDMLSLTQIPKLAAQVSIEPIDLLGVDAAILFADIMILPIAMGVDVRIVDNVGPIIDIPVDTPERIAALAPFSKERAAFLGETIQILRSKLEVPVIGFSGAPFTLASYLIEGQPSRTWTKTKRFMVEHPESWELLMQKLSVGISEYLHMQIEAGAQAIQLFDSWVGCLSPEQYRTKVLPHVQGIFTSLAGTVPRIHFGTNTAGILTEFSDVDAEVIGIDWRMRLSDAKQMIGAKTLQGNLDPSYLLGPWEVLTKEVDRMFTEIDPRQSYIFNLGHGMLPEANDAMARKLVEYVHTK
jgi:uroporphyrinogen decarboxylase